TTGPRNRRPGRRQRAPADEPVRPGEPRRDHPPRLPRGTPGRLPHPALATERARKRLALLEATDTELSKIVAAVDAGRLAGDGKIGIRVGKIIGRYKMAKHYTLDITNDQFAF